MARCSAEDVENQVTRIEDAIREDMTDIELFCIAPGPSARNIKFKDDSNYPVLFDDVRARIQSAQNRLPTVNGDPIVPTVSEVETTPGFQSLSFH